MISVEGSGHLLGVPSVLIASLYMYVIKGGQLLISPRDWELCYLRGCW